MARPALRVQRLNRRLRIRRHDLEQRARRTGWPRSMLLPVLQRAQVNADQLGEMGLTDLRRLADGPDDGTVHKVHGRYCGRSLARMTSSISSMI